MIVIPVVFLLFLFLWVVCQDNLICSLLSNHKYSEWEPDTYVEFGSSLNGMRVESRYCKRRGCRVYEFGRCLE